MDTAEQNRPTYFSPAQIAVATFIGAPSAGCWLMAHNFLAEGKPSLAGKWKLGGIVGTVVLLILSSFLPASVPNSALPIGYTIGLLQAAKHLFGTQVSLRIEAGHASGSWWKVIGVAVVSLAIIVATLIGAVMLLSNEVPA